MLLVDPDGEGEGEATEQKFTVVALSIVAKLGFVVCMTEAAIKVAFSGSLQTSILCIATAGLVLTKFTTLVIPASAAAILVALAFCETTLD